MASTSGRGTGSSSTSTTGLPRPASPTRWSNTRPTRRCQRSSSITTITCLPPAINQRHLPILPNNFSAVFPYFPLCPTFSHFCCLFPSPLSIFVFSFPKKNTIKVYGKRQRWKNMGKMGKVGKTPFSQNTVSFFYLFLAIEFYIFPICPVFGHFPPFSHFPTLTIPSFYSFAFLFPISRIFFLLFSTFNETACFFAFLLITEGATEKVLQFVVRLSSIYNKKPWFHWTKNVLLNTIERFKQEKVFKLTLFLP
jgi:hypothetical protein